MPVTEFDDFALVSVPVGGGHELVGRTVTTVDDFGLVEVLTVDSVVCGSCDRDILVLDMRPMSEAERLRGLQILEHYELGRIGAQVAPLSVGDGFWGEDELVVERALVREGRA